MQSSVEANVLPGDLVRSNTHRLVLWERPGANGRFLGYVEDTELCVIVERCDDAVAVMTSRQQVGYVHFHNVSLA